MKLEILYEDAYLLACVKPYGVLSQGDKGISEDGSRLYENKTGKRQVCI